MVPDTLSQFVFMQDTFFRVPEMETLNVSVRLNFLVSIQIFFFFANLDTQIIPIFSLCIVLHFIQNATL